MTTEIRHIGQFLPIDSDGYIVNVCGTERIVPPWSDAVDALIQVYCSQLGPNLHSVYLRGSVAQGTAEEGIADIDSFAVVEHRVRDRSWVAPARVRLLERFPFATGFEFGIFEHEKLLNSPKLWGDRFMLKTQSVCISGDDVSRWIPKFRADAESASRMHRNLKEVFERARTGVTDNPDVEDIREWCRWVMKRIVRAGFTLVMDRERAFTRDLYPAHTTFCKYYPDQQAAMRRALELAINPSDQPHEILQTVEGVGQFVQREIESRFGCSTRLAPLVGRATTKSSEL